ncbi:hypothetical protein P152DRAFT_462427 [Eremomyces bilateralis CBS 781.70]|uniref:Zn(2)-C6 fungal-type domain-containing protein n=1 Tax=Eremomyces bilateralis CBS 781.70 TaxID=1392243 RepID=A0A6G1FS01_9PEZI|nr:uncharacterized protein P152DRAFT_462427 [Eremomyces bilateralis CBS 781.70]KAF1808564.1 hypothetical protein P152DRAFT_462427 [Eremomyces bilateralis CBS 781.70]
MITARSDRGEDPKSARSPSVSDKSARRGSSTGADATAGKNAKTKKRRKVNHACIYCRRSHMTCDLNRPCNRCVKRSIGHLCHDEPREPAKKKADSANGASSRDGDGSKTSHSPDAKVNTLDNPNAPVPDAGLNIAASSLPQNGVGNTSTIVQPSPISAPGGVLESNNQSFPQLGDWNFGGGSAQSHSHGFQDMHSYPQYLFNTSEITNEYNLLNDFLSNSLVDDAVPFGNEATMDPSSMNLFSDPSLSMNNLARQSTSHSLNPNQLHAQPQDHRQQASQAASNQMLPPAHAAAGSAISRPSSAYPFDKAREAYYLVAADPAGNDTAEERLKKLLKAKYDAGLLRPFNYVKGYARLNQFMERNLAPVSRQKILKQLEKFRPAFRERVQKLTDLELVLVEMWFERSLMEYDRVFASMSIPACCWRRTGEIFRGNKEMAELIKVPLDRLRDGKIAIHEIFVENSLVSYWEKFGAIAFDASQKAILTSCSLKNPGSGTGTTGNTGSTQNMGSTALAQLHGETVPDAGSGTSEIRCCFSFTIKRDPHNIPALIVGNFLPILPSHSTQ